VQLCATLRADHLDCDEAILFLFDIFTFGLAWWMGLYLLGRDWSKALLRRAGFGLLCYALALAADLLSRVAADDAVIGWVTQLRQALIVLPALFWSGALFHLLPGNNGLHQRLERAWRWGLAPLVLVGLLLNAGAGLLVDDSGAAARGGLVGLGLLVFLPLVLGFVLVWRHTLTTRPGNAIGLLLAATIFFGLGIALLLFPLELVPQSWVILAIGGDLLLLGVAIAMLDAFDEGEALRAAMLRSFDAALIIALLFGGMVGLTMFFSTGVVPAMLALLLATVAAAIAMQTLAGPLEAVLDRVAFANLPQLRRARADLRGAAEALPRVNANLELAGLDEAEFARLTRRALGYYGDLSRLASSPLTRLPLIDARLSARSAPDDPIERATELKHLLAESIARLKPRTQGDFGTSDEWRYYNALYFPYVNGLKPYSQRANHSGLDPASSQALAWFRSAIPERTLYNWQNTAAKLVAQDLRSRMEG
jgi:hypothetical protein